ncbi:apolipoprotein N-acyltransferase [Methylopila henanensis]|uniref:Apolipoprotein N-acyltransferase n=1 Tax=Methylopila henanensis TaxID=873516 RepID=A0ABW4K7K0_9HYPH
MTRRIETLAAAAGSIMLASGWRRALIAFAAGAASALAMPPFSLWPVLALTFPVAVWLIDGAAGATKGRTLLSAAGAGWCFGFGYFLAGLWWIGSAFLVDADVFGWLLPFAVAGLPAGLALFHALGFALARALWSGTPARVLAFAAALGLAETARGHILTGFPWNAFGYALADQAWLGQFASVVGVEGLTFLALAIFAAPAALADARPAKRGVAFAVAALAALAVFGGVRLGLAETGFDTRVSVRAIQPEIPQDMKSQDAARDTIMDAYVALSDEARGPDRRGFADANLLVWPESAFPFLLSRTPEALARIAQSLEPGATLVTGAVRGERAADGSGATFWNAVHLVGDDGAIDDTYDKLHLVPFGEYLPFQSLLEAIGLEQLTRLQGGFASGTRANLITLPQGPRFRPLICYEAIFPWEITPGDRPDFLLNVTNDAWFGRTPGPYQHAAQARVRAVEQGLPLVRSANGGISMVVDAYGRTISSLPLGERGVVDAQLPLPIGSTAYYSTSGLLFLIFPVLFVLVAIRARRRV